MVLVRLFGSNIAWRVRHATSYKGGFVVSKNTADMTNTELYAHYKKTAPMGDLAFFLRCPTLSSELRAQAEAIAKPTKSDLARLRTRWRMERQAYELANHIPAVGSLAVTEIAELLCENH